MPCQAVYSAASVGRRRTVRGRPVGTPRRRATWRTGGCPRVRALLSVANRDGIAAFARDLLALGRRGLRHRRDARATSPAEGVEVALRLRADPGRHRASAARSRPSTTRSTPASWRDATSRPSSTSCATQGIGLIDLVVVNVKPFAPAIGAKLVGIDEAIEMIDVGGAALLGAAARNSAGVAAASDPAHYPQIIARAARARAGQPGDAGAAWRPRRSARSPPTTPRSPPTSTRSRATSSRRRLAIVLEKVDDLRYGENPHQHAAFYRETTHRSGTLADATRLQGDPPSFNNLLDLDAAYRIARDYTAPTVAIVKHTDPVGLASHDELVEAYRHARRDRPGGRVRRDRRGQPRAGRGDGPRDRRQLVRGGRGARASASRRSGSCAASPGWSCSPSRPIRPRACATTASPASTSSAIAGGLLVETHRRARARSRAAPGGHHAPADARGADRPAVRLAGGPPRPLERGRSSPATARRSGSGRARPAAWCRSRSRSAARAIGPSSRSWRPTPTSRSRTGSRLRPAPGVTAIIQPGGSIRDEMAIEVADRHHMAMVFTGRRHFRH